MGRRLRKEGRRGSTLWSRLHGALRMLCLLAVGVIALGVAANATPPGPQAGQVSEPVTTLELSQIVATEKAVYALAAGGQGVYEWSAHQDGWLKVFGPARNLYAGGRSVYATDQATGNIHKYTDRPGEWTRIGGPGAEFAAGYETLYGISPDHSAVYRYSGEGDVWTRIGGPAKNLFANPAKKFSPLADLASRPKPLYATDPATGDLHAYSSVTGRWTKAGGPGATFAVTDANVYGLTPDHSAVVERDGRSRTWKAVGLPADHIFSSETLYATARGTGDLHKYSGRSGRWDRIGGPAAAFATSGDHLYRLAPDRRSVQKYNGDGTTDQWLDLKAPAEPASREKKIARFSSLTRFGDDSLNAWYAALGAHRTGKPDVYEFRWTTNICNAPAPNTVAGFDFTLACVRHDFGYRNYRDLFGEDAFRNDQAGKTHIDRLFREDLNKICDGRGFPREHTAVARAACRNAAEVYYRAVVAFG